MLALIQVGVAVEEEAPSWGSAHMHQAPPPTARYQVNQCYRASSCQMKALHCQHCVPHLMLSWESSAG